MPRAKTPSGSPTDPDKLVRQQAGTYRTADDRFEVRGGGDAWFLVDTQQTNEFGQELITGPYATLKAVRAAIPPARDAKITPMRAPKARGGSSGTPKRSRGKRPQAEPPPPPPTWIDRLPKAEAREVRRLIGALEERGIDGAEDLVRQDREGLFPVVASRLVRHRLESLVEAAPGQARDQVRQLVREVAEILSGQGLPAEPPLPGWSLVEIGPEPEPPNRRIDLDR
ncbi:MAG TPA: hypothetical protein VHQ42_01255 [Candidatus Limnocylindria bacterium]|nr:hypothetical protein [Candidatus Limnocylindria bacterium]